MITSIIFSKNRACQLDLLLRSIQQNLPNFKDIYVLYKYTTPEFGKGYDLLIKRFQRIKSVIQYDFDIDTKNLTRWCTKDYICFFVDDNIIYKKCDLNEHYLNIIFEELNPACFSLRLGLNVKIQDFYNNIPTLFPTDLKIGSLDHFRICMWNWKDMIGFGNFNYPFSVDGHIYKKKDIIDLFDYKFENPNAFEGRFNKEKLEKEYMCCFEQSVLVNNPLNIVGSSNNNAGKYWGHTLEELNEKYLDNHQINLDNIMDKEIVGCHQEMEIEFEKI